MTILHPPAGSSQSAQGEYPDPPLPPRSDFRPLLVKHWRKLALGVVGVVALTAVIYKVTHPAARDRYINAMAEAASACGGSASDYAPHLTVVNGIDGGGWIETWTKPDYLQSGDYIGNRDYTDFFVQKTATKQLVKVEEEQDRDVNDNTNGHWQVQVTCPDGGLISTQDHDR
jgi:hypothetical protein